MLNKAVFVVVNDKNINAVKEAEKDGIGSLMEKAAEALSGKSKQIKTNEISKSDVLGEKYKLLEFQYNPASLSYRANADDVPFENPQSGGSGIITEISRPAETFLEFEAVFKGEEAEKQTNEFINMLSKEITRNVVFYWGDTCFSGELVHVNGKYDMFDSAGKPISSSINFRIRQEVKGGADLNYWNQAFDRMFD